MADRPKMQCAAIIAALALAGPATALPPWSPGFTWHVAPVPHSRQILLRQVGTAQWVSDDTTAVTFTDLNGNVQSEHASGWTTVSLAGLVPRNAKVALITVKTLITKPVAGNADVFVFARTPGTACCHGPASSPGTPVDFSIPENPLHLGIVAQAVQGEAGGVRRFDTVAIPLRNRSFQVAWGYQRQDGDAVGFDVYLDGYGS